MGKMTSLCLLLASAMLAACDGAQQKSPKDLYEGYLNLKLPSEVSNFTGIGTQSIFAFLDKGYFKYNASASYFEMLAKHDKFIQRSEFNEQICKVPCNDANFPKDFSYWTSDKIEIGNKTCYTGIFFPYVHYFIYDPVTKVVFHFVTGMRG